MFELRILLPFVKQGPRLEEQLTEIRDTVKEIGRLPGWAHSTSSEPIIVEVKKEYLDQRKFL